MDSHPEFNIPHRVCILLGGLCGWVSLTPKIDMVTSWSVLCVLLSFLAGLPVLGVWWANWQRGCREDRRRRGVPGHAIVLVLGESSNSPATRPRDGPKEMWESLLWPTLRRVTHEHLHFIHCASFEIRLSVFGTDARQVTSAEAPACNTTRCLSLPAPRCSLAVSQLSATSSLKFQHSKLIPMFGWLASRSSH